MAGNRGQSAIEVPIAIILLALLLTGAWVAALAAWRAADIAVAAEQSHRLAQRGGR